MVSKRGYGKWAGGISSALAMATMLLAASATAQARDYCPDRPGLTTGPCTIEPGRASVELSGVDWSRDASGDGVSDEIDLGDLALRYGIADHAELRAEWTPYGFVRERDAASGEITRMHGSGDLTLGIKRNIVDPSAEHFSLAVVPSVTLPTGGAAIGDGDWAAGLIATMTEPLGKVVTLELMPEVDAAVDGDRHGRHAAYGVTGGVILTPNDALSMQFEAAILHDEDPDMPHDISLAAASIAYKIGKDWQVDAGSAFGLNHDSDDARLYFGISHRF